MAFSPQFSSRRIALMLLFCAAITLIGATTPWRAAGQGGNQVATVSAASFAPALAPGSIAAAFGSRLAMRTEVAASQPLPTSLAGTTVRVNGEAAQLFFVSPGQINFLIPAGVPAGAASIVVTSGDGAVSNGTARIAPVAPALFTANASGQGALAAVLLRIKANGQQFFEPLAQFDRDQNRFVTRPLDFGEASDQLFLILFLTGVRQATSGGVRVNLGGVEYAPLFAGAAPGLVGVDQINLALPRNFGGRGRITLFAAAAGYGASNAGEFEIGSGTSLGAAAPLTVAAPSDATLAGQELEIGGAGFAANPRENTALIVADDGATAKADVLAVSGASLRIRVPFGAGTGQIKVSRGQIEAGAPIRVRTSVSGFIERAVQQDGRTVRLPVAGARVRVIGNPATEGATDAEGSFVMPDLQAANRTDFEILPPAGGSLNFPTRRFSLRVRANRDNQLLRGDEQTLVGGATFPLLADADVTSAEPGAAANPEQNLTLTFLEPGRTPANLPAGHFSSRIAQIAPFGQTISPGARLSFPNADAIPTGATARLFKFDQTMGSPTLGQFVDTGAATVTSDGQRIETAPNAITEGSFYFVSIVRPTAAINGRVVESDGRPAPRAIVQARGQSVFTDGFGGFVLRDVPVLKAGGDRVRVEVSYQRPDGRVARNDGAEVELTAGALNTIKGEIALGAPATNLPPVILAPPSLALIEGDSRLFDISITDPDGASPPQLALAGTATVFAAFSSQGAGVFRLTLSPNAPGSFALDLTATDAAGGRATERIAITVNARGNAPAAESQSVTTPEDVPRPITLTSRAAAALGYAIVSGPARGSLSGVSTGAPNLVYTPARDFNGVDAFTFRVSSGGVQSEPATVFIAVSPVNDAPVLSLPGPQTVNAGETLNLIVAATDVDGDRALRITAAGLPPGATLTEAGGASRQLSWTPAFTEEGAYTPSFTATDGGAPALGDTKTLAVRVVAKWALTSGPEGGEVTALADAGGALFAGTDGGGVYRSTDGGRSWARAGNGLMESALFVQSLLASGGSLYAGTSDGVYRTIDGGQTWAAVNNGLDFVFNVPALLASGSSLYAGTDDGVYRSTDGGRNWMRASNGLPSQGVTALLASGSSLYAGTDGGGVYRSTDGGQSWVRAANGLMGSALNVVALLVSGNSLYAGTQAGVYRSTDGGQSWAFAGNGLPGVQTGVRLTALSASGGSLYVGTSGQGVYRSIDGGQSWTRTSGPGAGLIAISARSVAALLVSGSNLYAGTRDGVHRSPDGGERWMKSSSGISASSVISLLSSGNAVYAGKSDGVYRTTDGGQNWVRTSNGLVLTSFFIEIDLSVLALHASGSNLYAGTTGAAFVTAGGEVSGAAVYRSADGGQNWVRASEGLRGGSGVYALATSGNNLYAGTFGEGVYRSTNGGQSWMRASNGLTGDALDILALQASGNNLFAGTNGDGVYRSTDGGQSWVRASNGLAARTVLALLASGSSLYAGTEDDGVYRSTDGGQSWIRASNGLEDVFGVFALQVSGSNLYAGTNDGVYRSTNNGQSWTRLGTELLNPFVQSLVVSGAKLFAGIESNGVSVLADAEQSWVQANGNLANKSVNTVASSGGALFAGTLGGGVFRSANQGQNWAAANAGLPPNPNIQSLVTDGATLWAAAFGDGVYASTNQGASWTPVNTGLTNRFVNALFLSGATLYAGTDSGVFRSSDGGANWTVLNAGLGNRRVLCFALNAGTLHAGTESGAFRLGGENWTATGLSNLAVRALGVGGEALYAGTLDGGIFVSRDSGQNWTAVNNQLPSNLNVFAFAASGRKVYAGSIYGVFVTEDEGRNWKQVNAGLLDVFVTGLAVSGDRLIASTASGGVFGSRIP